MAEGASSSTSVEEPIIFTNSHGRNDRLRLLTKIGIFSHNRNRAVYKAVRIFPKTDHYTGMKIEQVFIVVKYVKKDADEYRYLHDAAERSLKHAPCHQNLIPIMEPFYDNDHYIVSFPFMRGGSLRHILSAKYPDGMPEDWIVVILKEVLLALSALHKNNTAHCEINAGNIFFSPEPKIRLAYAASVYTPTALEPPYPSSYDYLHSYNMATWAAAPEVYRETYNRNLLSQDVWMVGITALELTCGTVWVKDREDFEKVIRKINRKRELPSKILRAVAEMGRLKKPIFEINKGEEFSKAFQRMVAMCLGWEADSRPTVDELLQLPLFRQLGPFYSALRAAPVRV